MGGTYTEAQKNATSKYLKTLKSVQIKIKHEQYNIYKEYADKKNISLRELIITALNEKIEREQ